ncbi:MAG TPA: hypothetical protein VFV38_22935 [Ktedonobacteraceae bacterium]|nr:hypothetical protein [Ktedonobacteraceae bacterium]
MEHLTIHQAYLAMMDFLEGFYQRTGSDDVAVLLGGMQFLSDKNTADSAAWDDWMKSVSGILMPDTPTNRQRWQDLLSDPKNYQGTDSLGNQWYAQTLADGSQLWAKVRHGVFKYGGIRQIPRMFDPQTGLSSPESP